MSTFAVFGMTRDVAVTQARKTTSGERRTPKGVEYIPMEEWLRLVEKAADRIMAGTKVVQLSPMFDAPQYAEQFIGIARKGGNARDLQIRFKAQLKDAKGHTVINKKTKAPKGRSQ